MHLFYTSSVLPKETTVSDPQCLTCPALPGIRPKAQNAHQKHDSTQKYISIFDSMYDEELTAETTQSSAPLETIKKKKKSKRAYVAKLYLCGRLGIEIKRKNGIIIVATSTWKGIKTRGIKIRST